MWTRRRFLTTFALIPPFLSRFASFLWAQVREILPRGFSREKLRNMNPAKVDTRNLEIDPIEKFGTMGPTDVPVDITSYRLHIKGAVHHPLSLSYDQIRNRAAITEAVLLICPGFFAYHAQWSGVSLKGLLQEAKVKEGGTYVDIKGAYNKTVRIPLKELDRKKIFLAYRVNGEILPKKHGFPLRLVYEDAYGYDWVKYVDEIIVV